MDTSTDRVAVAFEGGGAGVEELTWGQRDVWDLMRRTGRTMNIGGTTPAGDGATVEGVAALLRFVVGRHPALRTRLRPGDGGPPRQEVHAGGEIALEVVDTEGDADGVAEALRVRYQTTPFDPVSEWPIRMGIVRRHGRITHAVVMYYHVVVDGFGIDAVVRDMRHLGDPAAPVEGVGPLQLARDQRTPEAVRTSEKALRYWERQLGRVPVSVPVFSGLADGPGLRFREFVTRSPALALAVRAVAARTGVATGAILLAAYASALARATGSETAAVQLVVSNRFRAGFADAVGSLRQFGLAVIDVGADGDFDDLARRAFGASLGAFKHGYYDAAAHHALLAGSGRDVSCYLNDRRRPAAASPIVPDPAAIRAASPLTERHWGVQEDTYDGTWYLHVEDDPDAITYTLWGDTYRYPAVLVERCARDIEAVILAAV